MWFVCRDLLSSKGTPMEQEESTTGRKSVMATERCSIHFAAHGGDARRLAHPFRLRSDRDIAAATGETQRQQRGEDRGVLCHTQGNEFGQGRQPLECTAGVVMCLWIRLIDSLQGAGLGVGWAQLGGVHGVDAPRHAEDVVPNPLHAPTCQRVMHPLRGSTTRFSGARTARAQQENEPRS